MPLKSETCGPKWKVRETIYDYGDIKITAIEVDEATKASLSTGGARLPPLNPSSDGDLTIIGTDVQRMYDEIVHKREKDCFLRKTVVKAKSKVNIISSLLFILMICATFLAGYFYLSY